MLEIGREIADLEAQIKEFQQNYGVFSVEALANEHFGRKADIRTRLILKEMEIQSYSSFTRINDPVSARLRAERESLVQLLREMESGASLYDGVLPAQDALADLAVRFGRMQRDLRVQTEIYTLLTQQYELSKLSIEGEEPIFQVLELADAPDVKAGPRRSIIVSVATLIAFFVSLIAAFALNAVRRIAHDPAALRHLRGDG